MVNNDFQAELVWKEKYDKLEIGEKKPIEKTPLPFQKVETINKPRDKQQALFSRNKEDGWINKIIWGDNKYILASLVNGDPSINLESLKGKIKLIYIDPPFFTGSNMSIKIATPNGDSVTKEPSIVEEVAYRNIWKDGLNSFCQWIYERLLLMKDLLAEDGTIFVRFDWHYSHYVKLIMDDVFGKDNFIDEIIVGRKRDSAGSRNKFEIASESIFVYSKTNTYNIKDIYGKRSLTDIKWTSFLMAEERNPRQRVFFGLELTPPKGQHFSLIQEKCNKLVKENYVRLRCKSCGARHYYAESEADLNKRMHSKDKFKFYDINSETIFFGIKELKKCLNCGKIDFAVDYLGSEDVKLNNLWLDIESYSSSTGYPTENSEALLERVIECSSDSNDLVADFFGGSGTTAAVAEKLGRKWIIADIGKFSIHTIRKRILDIDLKKDNIIRQPFEILNLGKYERQQWQIDNLGKEKIDYLKFIVELYHSKFVEGFRFLHGKTGDKMVHVGSIDSAVTWNEIKDCLEECKVYKVKKLDILGWEFENGLHSLIEDEAKDTGVTLSLRYIPREVMDKRAVDGGDIDFFELAFLDVDIQKTKDSIKIKLKDFMIPNSELVPEESKKRIKNFADYIDYWAVDWNFKEDTFHNEWQTFRTKSNKELSLISEEHTYSKKGKYKVMVKVVDIFGNDTTQLIEVEIK